MRRKKLRIVLVIVLMMALVISACSSSKSSTSNMDTSNGSGTTTGIAEGAAPIEEVGQDANLSYTGEDKSTNTDSSAGSDDSSVTTAVNPNQKLIRTFNLQVETQEYDSFLPTVQQKVLELGGYIESSQLDGNSYYDETQRYAQIVARVPKAKVDEFVSTVSKMGNVTSKSENAKDVTLAYTDTESHQKSLKIEQERLLVLLEKATKLADIITLEDRLSQVRYEIESYESQLRTYDNQVDYSTVSLTINEVQRITVVSDETAFDKMKSGFSDTIYSITTGLVNFAIWFVVNLPYLIIWAVVIVILVLVIRKSIRKYSKKNKIIEEKSVKPEIKEKSE